MKCAESGCDTTLAGFNKSGFCTKHYGKAPGVKERMRKWYRDNKERHRSGVLKWIKNNPERNKEMKKNWEANNSAKIKESRSNNRKFWDSTYRRFRITAEQYWQLHESQQGLCAICSKKSEEDFRGRLSVDHCHKEGQIRGLLCNHCNLMLGHARDNIDTLTNAIEYLQQGFNNKTDHTDDKCG
jgi:hypothetical protein